MSPDIDTLRQMALAILIAETRPVAVLDDEVRAALGMRARKGRLRLDDLSLRLVQLIDSSDLWRVWAVRARKRLSAPALTGTPRSEFTLSQQYGVRRWRKGA